MLLLELLYLLTSLVDLRLQLVDLLEAVFILLLRLIKMRFHVASGCDSLNCKPLFSLEFISEVVSFVDELVVLFHGHCHLTYSIILLFFALLSKDGFRSEHSWQQLSVTLDPLKFVVNRLLKVPRILKLRQVEVLVLIALVLSLLEFLSLINLMGLKILDSLFVFFNG